MPVTSSRWERSAFGLVTPSQQLLYTLAFVAWPSINVLSVPRPHLLGGMMSTPKIPGFTAERSVYRTRANYRTMAGPGVRRSHEIDAVRLQACDLDCIDECQQGCEGLTGREHAQCIRLCRVECGCLSQPPVCGNCECSPSSGWSQRCCRPDGTACSRRPCTPPERVARCVMIAPVFPGRLTPSAGGAASEPAAIGRVAINCCAEYRSADSGCRT